MKTLENQIKSLEEKLLHSDVRSNPEILDELLAEKFEEIGVTGSVTSRQEVIDWLKNKEKHIRWSLDNFRLKQIAPGIILCHYEAKKQEVIENKSKVSMRSSIWKLYGNQWKMVFHQGTRIEGSSV